MDHFIFRVDFIKQVVENGNKFEKSHYFMMLMQLSEKEMNEPAMIQSLKIITEELKVTEFEYVQFNQGIKDTVLRKAFFRLWEQIYPKEKKDD